MRLFKRNQNCLFVEEESYNWKAAKSSTNKRLFYLALLFIVAGILFGMLN
ncbi:MAG: hypothetical protein HOG51_05100 [Gammaproteobacteria bacterium]|nr:hypothetical protein [Gammaproteobacteria bacterium]